MASLGYVLTDLSHSYELADYNNETDVYNRLDATFEEAETLKNTVNQTADVQSNFDILGLFVSKSIDSLKITFQSMGNAVSMASTATSAVGLPNFWNTAIIAIILIAVIITVFMRVMTKSEL